MKLSEMKQTLVAGNLRLTKSLGQNFLHDGNQLRRVVAAAELSEGDSVLEVGPGLGPLTELLLAQAGRVLAIEKDRRLFELLQQRLAASRNLTLRHDDALTYLRQQRSDWSQWKLVANLPYSVASPILVELAQMPGCPQRLVATVQLEVAQRIAAPPASPDYGILTLLLQLRYEARAWFKIPATCFFPRPDVDSACVTLLRRAQPLLTSAEAITFERLVKRSFSQRRKMMLKLLKEDWPVAVLEAAFEQIGLTTQERAEQVRLEQFVQLAQKLAAFSDQAER
jgi:16S rRNA (adenine1518-N6/adenine1519-N6)-dimethyltransferase